jgi:hypothetical protein
LLQRAEENIEGKSIFNEIDLNSIQLESAGIDFQDESEIYNTCMN